MVAFNYEQDTCTGRGFITDSANGILKNFHDWVTRSAVSTPVSKSTGGPAWFIIDDQSITSGGSANKVARLSSVYTGVGTSFDTIAEIAAITDGEFKITINAVANDITAVDFTGDATWDDVASTLQVKIRAASASANDGYDSAVVKHIYTSSTGDIDHVIQDHGASSTENKHRFIIVVGEADMAILALAAITSPSGTALHGGSYLNMANSSYIIAPDDDPFIVVSDNSSPTALSGAKFLKVGMDTTEAGQIFIENYMWWDTTIHKGFGITHTKALNTFDDAEFVYDFRGGPEFLSIGTRLNSAWDHFAIDEWTDNTNLVEDNTKASNTVAALSAGATGVDVTASEGSNFTANKYYWLIDLTQAEAVEYVKVTVVATDTLTFETALTNDFASGALLTSYYQRTFSLGNQARAISALNRYTTIMALPLRSLINKEWGIDANSGNAYSTARADYLLQTLIDIDPDDEGSSAVMKPLIGEVAYAGTDGNRYYGTPKNMYYTGVGTMAQMLNGRTISSAAWVYFQLSNAIQAGGSASIAAMIPNYNQT